MLSEAAVVARPWFIGNKRMQRVWSHMCWCTSWCKHLKSQKNLLWTICGVSSGAQTSPKWSLSELAGENEGISLKNPTTRFARLRAPRVCPRSPAGRGCWVHACSSVQTLSCLARSPPACAARPACPGLRCGIIVGFPHQLQRRTRLAYRARPYGV